MTPVASSVARRIEPSLTAFLQILFRELAARNVRYCVLHSYEELPERLPSDLDIAITQDQFQSLPQIFAALERNGYHPVQCLNYEVNGYYFVFAWLQEGAWHTAAVDFIGEHREGKLILTSGEELIRQRRAYGGFWIPASAVECRYLLSKKVLKNVITTQQSRRLEALARELGENETREICVKLFGAFWADAPLLPVPTERSPACSRV